MNTEMMERFEVLDADRLASVEGGKVGAGEVIRAAGICTMAGAIVGSLIVPGAGTWAGGILGAQYCTSLWAIGHSL